MRNNEIFHLQPKISYVNIMNFFKLYKLLLIPYFTLTPLFNLLKNRPSSVVATTLHIMKDESRFIPYSIIFLGRPAQHFFSASAIVSSIICPVLPNEPQNFTFVDCKIKTIHRRKLLI